MEDSSLKCNYCVHFFNGVKMIEKMLKKLNLKAIKHGDVPVSCIITKNDRIIASSYNKKKKNNDPLAHAEILAIRKACKKLKTSNLSDCKLYVSLMPCNMCKDVINEARIKEVYYILDSEKVVNNTTKFTKVSASYQQYFENELKNFFSDKR